MWETASRIFIYIFRINDRVISANNVSLEGVDYATAVQVLRDSGQTVNLVVKRRVVLPPVQQQQQAPTQSGTNLMRVGLSRSKKKEDFGVVLGCKIYIKDIVGKSLADKDGILKAGDLVLKINQTALDGLTLKDARKLIETAKDKLDLVIKRSDTANENGLTDELEKSNLSRGTPYNGVDNRNSGIYASRNENGEPPPRPPMPWQSNEGKLTLSVFLHVLYQNKV